MGLRFKDANVTHPELKTTFKLPMLSVKKNPQSNTYTSLGVITKGKNCFIQELWSKLTFHNSAWWPKQAK